MSMSNKPEGLTLDEFLDFLNREEEEIDDDPYEEEIDDDPY